MSEHRSTEPRGVSRRAFVQGTALAGFAAFLAACTGTKASASPSAAPHQPAAPRRRWRRPSPRRPRRHSPDSSGHHRTAQVRDLARIHRPGGPGDADDRRPPGGVVQDARGLQKEVRRRGRLRREDHRRTSRSTRRSGRPWQATCRPGWDLMVLTDWMAAKIIAKGWAERWTRSTFRTASRTCEIRCVARRGIRTTTTTTRGSPA